MIAFFAPGDPKGQPRPRAFARGGHARVFDPGTAEGWKSAVALAAREHVRTPLDGALRVEMLFTFRRPKGHYRTGKNSHVLRDDAPTFHTSKPDADNLAKAVLDALTTLGAWRDDAQVSTLIVTKDYGDTPGVRVEIAERSDR